MAKRKINSQQLPVKAHFFFFMAAMGPILPFITVYGRQIGISPMIMGTVTAILPIIFLIAKPSFGYLVDYFRTNRKSIFISLLICTSLSFAAMNFLPEIEKEKQKIDENIINSTRIDCKTIFNSSSSFCNSFFVNSSKLERNRNYHARICNISCDSIEEFTRKVIFFEKGKSFCLEDEKDKLKSSICYENSSRSEINDDFSEKNASKIDCGFVNCEILDESNDFPFLYETVTFWGFVVLMSLGCIGFNVTNSISDAICFDVLGEGGEMGYGRQRVWGTIGFGLTAFLAGYTVDWWSQGQEIKTYTPAFALVLTFTCFDVICCTKLDLPIMTGSNSIIKDVYGLLKLKPIVIFLVFATLAGIFDSFIIYFMFWYLEDLAELTGHMGQIKLIEGLIVAAETLGGEVIFFSLSGKILKKIGYGYSFVFCFVCYAIRLALVSMAPNPWWVIPIEFFMQGPTYALCYTSIVAFASVVAPPGTSATVQGIVAGMDDGFGFAVGSLVGGILYKNLGGATTLRIFSLLAAITSIMYFILHIIYLRNVMPETRSTQRSAGTTGTTESMSVGWTSPENAIRECHSGGET